MKLRFLVLLATLFSLSAISLVIIQVVQTRKTATISNNLFNINVCSSVENVCAQLDQMKIEEYVTNKERYYLLRHRRVDELNEKMQNLIRDNSDLFYDERRIDFGISTQDSAFARPGYSLYEREKGIIDQYNTLLNARNRLLNSVSGRNRGHSQATFEHVIDASKLNYPLLDSLIREELIINCGEDLHPTIGVLQCDRDTLLYCSNPSDSDKLTNTAFKYSFQPNGISVNNNLYILLAFPTSPNLLTNNTNPYTLISVCLIVIIAILFVFSIRTIWSQKKLDEMKTDFINNMTHEIKTPLATVGLACEMLKDETIANDADTRRNSLNIISEENRKMLVLIETLLQSAKMASKRFTISPKEVDLNQIIQNAARSFSLTLANRHGTINLNLQPITDTLYADEMHLSNAIHNLIDNAIKYSEDELLIDISTQQKSGFVVLKIEDHGIGIAKDDQVHIFEKFYRVSTGNVHNIKGFGIGLNYVSQVVALHSGKITIESELGKGSVFTIQLPTV